MTPPPVLAAGPATPAAAAVEGAAPPASTRAQPTPSAPRRPSSLTPAQMATWRTFLRAHATLVRRLEGELVAEHDLPLASYDVLVQLSEAPQRRLRMTELAERVLLSRSGLTRLVDRLSRDGLVERESCPSDARGTLAVLTPAGLDRLRRAWPTHRRGVAQHIDRLTDAEVETLGALLDKLVPAGPGDRAGDAADGGS